MKPKAKSTWYDNVLYRSRTEARWAVFMDLLGIIHVYEPHQAIYDTGAGDIGYRVNFFLPGLGHYLEVKRAGRPSRDALSKAAGLARVDGDLAIVCGFPRGGVLLPEDGYMMEGFAEHGRLPLLHQGFTWVECPRCLKVHFWWDGEPNCGCYSEDEIEAMLMGEIADVDCSRTQSLLKAYRIARNISFEGALNKMKPLQRQGVLV